ncbi:MAG: hypothetical protein J5610_01620 [Prevotella sp.]|nr:hypothetical protein [Prevotella sp.]
MKKLFLLMFLFVFVCSSNAQTSQTKKLTKQERMQLRQDMLLKIKKDDPFIIIKEFGGKLHDVRDKVIVENESHFFIRQIAIAIINDEGNYIPVCSVPCVIAPGETYELVAYSENELEALRKKTVAIKIKGANTDEPLEIVEKDAINYDFSVNLSEYHHDLHMKVSSTVIPKKQNNSNKEHKNIMDF